MQHIWLRNQHSPLMVWQPKTKTWQSVANWQLIKDTFGTDGICLYFPTRHLLQIETPLTQAQLKQLGNTGQQYLFEDIALTPIEQLKIRHLHHNKTNYLYAIAQQHSDQWQKSIELVGLSPIALIPDFLLLPDYLDPQQISLYQDSQTSLIRQTQYQGMAVNHLPLTLERLTWIDQIHLITSIDPTAQNDPQHLAQQNWLTTQTQLTLTPSNQIPTPLDTPDKHPLNFFKKTTQIAYSSHLKTAIIIASLALITQLLVDTAQWYRYRQANQNLQTAIATQYQTYFPEETYSPRLTLTQQMGNKLNPTQTNQASKTQLMESLSRLIRQQSLTAQSLKIDPNQLTLKIIAPNRSELDQLTKTLNAQGLSAQLGGIENLENGELIGQIKITLTNPT